MTQKYACIRDLARQYPVTLIGRVLEVARSGYYAWMHATPRARATQDAQLTAQIERIATQSRHTYGSPRIHAALRAQGVRCGRKRVARLMRHAHIVARRRRPTVRTTIGDPTHPVAPNTLDRDFQAHAPNTRWLTDITSMATTEGWVYLAVVLDLFARRVVGWAMQATLDRSLVLTAFTHAGQRRHVQPGLLHHSDRGSQYTSDDDQAALARAQMDVSMSRTGNCWDNAPMESFFATLKAELPMTVFPNHAVARAAIFDSIERFYNRQRRHSSLGYRTPAEAERDWYADQKAA